MTDASDRAELTLLGTGTLVPSGTRASAAFHLAADGLGVLVDCGSGTLHGLARHAIDWPALSHVFVTHYHYDHLGDLPALLIAYKHGLTVPRTAELTLVGPPGFGAHLSGLAAAHGIAFLEQRFPLRFVELAPGDTTTFGALQARAFATAHTDESLGYRFGGRWGSVGYTGDTGPTTEVEAGLAGVDVLVAECSHPDRAPVEGHLTPSSLGALVSTVEPRLTVVTHVYPTHTVAEAVDVVAATSGRRVVAGVDGARIRLGTGDITVDLPR